MTRSRSNGLAFDFGENWAAYSANRLSSRRLDSATESIRSLIGADSISGQSFVDVGCGSGLFTIAAARLGAGPVVGFDVNASAVAVAQDNAKRFCGSEELARVRFCETSVLDREELLRFGQFDIVYAWGSLHHTGDMVAAIRNASALAKPGGLFVLAIYNRHWTSPLWTAVKVVYNLTPRLLRPFWNGLFAAPIFVATLLVTGKSPLQKERGMDFWYDVIDWLGGYPYEYATQHEIEDLVRPLGFEMVRCLAPRVPTGCNEFVFRRVR